MAPRRKTKTRYRNHLWVTDSTAHTTLNGRCFLAINRRICVAVPSAFLEMWWKELNKRVRFLKVKVKYLLEHFYNTTETLMCYILYKEKSWLKTLRFYKVVTVIF